MEAEPLPADANAPHKTAIFITGNSLVVGYGDDNSQSHHAVGGQAVIICDSFNLASASGEQPKLQCQNCKVTLPNGAKGTASDAIYDTAKKKLTLTGSKDQPVKLTLDAGGVVQSMSTPTIELELNFSAQPYPTTQYQVPQAAGSVMPSSPYAADPPRSDRGKY
jgi:hypothetical protein